MKTTEFNRDWEKTKNITFSVYDIEWLCQNENEKYTHLSFRIDKQSFDRFFNSKWESIFDSEKVNNYLSDCMSYNGWLIGDYKYSLIKQKKYE